MSQGAQGCGWSDPRVVVVSFYMIRWWTQSWLLRIDRPVIYELRNEKYHERRTKTRSVSISSFTSMTLSLSNWRTKSYILAHPVRSGSIRTRCILSSVHLELSWTRSTEVLAFLKDKVAYLWNLFGLPVLIIDVKFQRVPEGSIIILAWWRWR